MKQVFIKKAEKVVGEIEDTLIIISDSPERSSAWRGNRDFYMSEAHRIAEALCTSLPGGTLDQLICELLQQRASLLIVPLFGADKESKP